MTRNTRAAFGGPSFRESGTLARYGANPNMRMRAAGARDPAQKEEVVAQSEGRARDVAQTSRPLRAVLSRDERSGPIEAGGVKSSLADPDDVCRIDGVHPGDLGENGDGRRALTEHAGRFYFKSKDNRATAKDARLTTIATIETMSAAFLPAHRLNADCLCSFSISR